MADDGDLALAEKIGKLGGKMLREYIAEMRRQGRIKGRLWVVVKDGRRQILLPYRENP